MPKGHFPRLNKTQKVALTCVPPAGFEPATHGVETHCSNPLSYGGVPRHHNALGRVVRLSGYRWCWFGVGVEEDVVKRARRWAQRTVRAVDDERLHGREGIRDSPEVDSLLA